MGANYIDKLGFILIQERKMLVVRDQGKSVWLTPGGKREENETDIEALTREIQEELQVSLTPESISYYGTFEAQAHGKPEGTLVRITCYTGAFDGEATPGNEIEELAWVDSRNTAPLSITGQMILDDLVGKNLID